MRRAAALLILAAILVAALPASSAGAAVRRPVLQCSGCWPTAFAFTPNGNQIFYVRRFSGEIWVKNIRTGRHRLWARIPNVATGAEQGALGIALDPGWPDRGWVYVYFTEDGSPDRNRIARFRKPPGGGVQRQNLLRIPASDRHNGGVIHFGPDGRLYAVTGDANNASNSQNIDSRAGKVLRMTRGGRVPGDNPFPGSFTFSYGHRNSFGFTFDPRTGRLWQTENGPQCNDEVNLVRRGRNYGWGSSSRTCPNTNQSGPEPRVAPKWLWRSVIAPTGAVFCIGCRVGEGTGGSLLVGSWNDRRIRRMKMSDNRRNILGQRVVFTNSAGVLALEARPTNGRVYFSDQNGIYRLARG